VSRIVTLAFVLFLVVPVLPPRPCYAFSLQTAKAHFESGLGKHRKGDLDGAIADYTKAIELDPR